MIPAGVVIPQRDGAQANVLLDYVLPAYRDFRVARFFFHEQAAYFHRQGIDRFVSAPGRSSHAKYLEQVGFHRKDGMYILELGGGVMNDSHL